MTVHPLPKPQVSYEHEDHRHEDPSDDDPVAHPLAPEPLSSSVGNSRAELLNLLSQHLLSLEIPEL